MNEKSNGFYNAYPHGPKKIDSQESSGCVYFPYNLHEGVDTCSFFAVD